MEKNEEFYKIKEIFKQIPELDVHARHGGRFHFPVYLTENLANTPVEALELSVRSYNCLMRAGITTIGALCQKVRCSSDLKHIRNCGKTSIAEILDTLFAYQYYTLSAEKREAYLAEVIEMNVPVKADSSDFVIICKKR